MKKVKLLIAMTFIGLASVNFTACSKSDDTPQKQEIVKTEEWEPNHVELTFQGQKYSVPFEKECPNKSHIEFYSNNTNKIFSYDKDDDCKERIIENPVKIEGNKIQLVFKSIEFSGTFKKYDKEVRVTFPATELEKMKGVIKNPEFEEALPMLIAANAEIIIVYDRK